MVLMLLLSSSDSWPKEILFLYRFRSSRLAASAAAASGLLILREGAFRCFDLDFVRVRSCFRCLPPSSERLLPCLVSTDVPLLTFIGFDEGFFLVLLLLLPLMLLSSTIPVPVSSLVGSGGGGGVNCPCRLLDEMAVFDFGENRFLCSLWVSDVVLSPLDNRFRAWTAPGLFDFFLEGFDLGDECFFVEVDCCFLVLGLLMMLKDLSDIGLEDRSDLGLVSLR